MKKLVLVAALFMFVCGGTFLAQAKGYFAESRERPRHSKSGPITVSTLQQKSRFLLVYSGKRLFLLSIVN